MTVAAVVAYLSYVGGGLALLIAALSVYSAITPYHEIRLIRAGNQAAACSLGGTAIGLAIVIHTVAAHSVSWIDMIIWSALAVVFQLVVFVIVTFVLPGFREGLESGKTSYGIALGAFSIAMGVLNAGSLTT